MADDPGTVQELPVQPAATKRGLRMTEGPVGRLLFKLTVPLAWGILAVLGYRLAEAWFVGALGPGALAAISFAFPVTMVVLSLSIGLGAGTSSVIARALGAREEGLPRLVADALILTLVLGVASAAIGILLADSLARLLGAGPDLAPSIAAYLRVWFPTAILILLPQVGLSAARAAGDAAFQGVAMVASTALNLAFAPIAITGAFGFHGLGLVGAPVATALAWLPLLWATLWRLRRLHILSFEHLRLDEFLRSSRRILRVGLPAAATNTVIPISGGIITALLAPYGHDVVAGFGLGSRVESVAMVPFFALSAVMNPFAGQNFGAGRIGRVREAMVKVSLFCGASGTGLAALLFFGRHWIATRFTGDAAVTQNAMLYLALVPISYGPGGLIAIANAAFNGLNRPFYAVVVSVARTLLVNVPVAWVLGRLYGVPGIFFGICLSNLLVGVASGLWVLSVTKATSQAVPCSV
jgi:putative MATE family efflux protein